MTKKPNNTLRDIAASVQKKLVADLGVASPIKHSVTKGNSTEKVWIDLFGKYLPQRFRVASAIIIDSHGKTSEQIDCVIFDAHFTPQIMPDKESLYIPAEAVHAVFEVKQKATKGNLRYAAKKICSVRQLHRTSASYTGDGQSRKAKQPFRILGGLLATSMGWKDGFDGYSFFRSLKEAQQIAILDFIFVAEVGYANIVSPQIPSKQSITYGLFRLLEGLTRQGTVPAVDWSKYYSGF